MPEQQLTRRLAAILAADVVGYSRMMGADEAGTVAALRKVWSETFNPAVAARHGRIVKMMGDGALVEFGSVVDAVECAVAVQRAMGERNRAAERPVTFRIGINLGDIVIEGDDIFGDGVNVAARLESQAPQGGILVSDVVHAQVNGKVGIGFADAGEVSLKNIERPLRVWRWGGDEGAAPREPVARARPAAEAQKPSIAVLPFSVMSNDPEQEFFADGLVEDILTTLSKLSGLSVIARNSSFAYKGRTVDVRQVARELGVRYVLEGSVRKAGNRIRITAQLIDATTGIAHLGGALRPRHRRHLCRAGRDHADARHRDAGPADRGRAGAPALHHHDQRRSVELLDRGAAVRSRPGHRRQPDPRPPRLGEGAGAGSRLRPAQRAARLHAFRRRALRLVGRPRDGACERRRPMSTGRWRSTRRTRTRIAPSAASCSCVATSTTPSPPCARRSSLAPTCPTCWSSRASSCSAPAAQPRPSP